MATKIPEEGKGVLFSNDKKGNEKAPDFKGEVMANGKLIKLSAWKRTSAYGELISLAVNPMATQQYPREVKQQDDQDVPF
ncbi:hypothetical protein UFOVP513_44 [uncultured Caudovirales phage]|jgi:hypothetical protein|uniref:Uncharacterized protein n=1 Tax=uncultured Caudovirales phage TaxID=2100421 RepID=A0A6J5MNL7_9CAUD|nr:hypothetical protein UFOVP513_44 [uncultured Caudovirales phage]